MYITETVFFELKLSYVFSLFIIFNPSFWLFHEQTMTLKYNFLIFLSLQILNKKKLNTLKTFILKLIIQNLFNNTNLPLIEQTPLNSSSANY